VIPGLSGFVPIEASRGAKRETINVPVLRLQQGATMPDALPSPAADNGAPPPAGKPSDALKAAFKDQVHAVIDDDTLDIPGKITKIRQILKAQEKAMGLIEPVADAGDSALPIAASRSAPDPMLVKLAGKSRRQDLDGLVIAGKITPAVRDKLAAQYITGDALTLSLNMAGIAQFDGLVDALSVNASVVATGERTGPQALALSRQIPVGDEVQKSREAAGKELRAMTARAAGMPVEK
jgi:hypothetical protein